MLRNPLDFQGFSFVPRFDLTSTFSGFSALVGGVFENTCVEIWQFFDKAMTFIVADMLPGVEKGDLERQVLASYVNIVARP